MYAKRFEPITDKCSEIIEFLMASPDIPENPKLRFKIRLSIEEIVENIVCYAYENGAGYLEASTKSNDGMLSITFTDEGKPFDPLAKPDPDIKLSAKQRAIGGLGIFICKKMMDRIFYEYKDGRNILTLNKATSNS